MSDLSADDVIKRLGELQMLRVDHERYWQQIAAVAAPDAGNFTFNAATMPHKGLAEQANAARRSAKIYDTTAITSIDRLSAGIEDMIVPQSEYWHNLSINDFTFEKPSNSERRWLERVRDVTFKARYDADSGWQSAIQTCLRRVVAFGNAFMFVEEGTTSRALIRYRPLPLEECFVADNYQGQIDTFIRPYTLTARQALQKFGAQTPPKIAEAAQSKSDCDKPFTFIHAIGPRSDWGRVEGVQGAAYYSVHVFMEERVVVATSGFYQFPIIDFRWLPEPGRVYGEGPVQKALADIQSLNLMAKNELIASQQSIDPPLLLPHAGVMNRPNTHPGAINMGGMSPNGQKLIEPLFTGQRLDFASAIRQAKSNQVKESLYINLFQTLINNPQMSATEALIRANEKAALLGPAAGRLQQSLSNLVERELGILTDKGLFNKDSAYAVPRSLQGRNIAPEFTSPLDKERKSREATGTIRMFEILSPMMAIDPTVADYFDTDEMAPGLADVLQVPAKFVRPNEVVAQIRKQRAEAQAAQQQAMLAKEAALAGKAGAEGFAKMKEAQAA